MSNRNTSGAKEWPVLRVLRRIESQEYFTGSGWTREPEQAKSFQDAVQAAQACTQMGLSGIELVLRVRGGQADFYSSEFR